MEKFLFSSFKMLHFQTNFQTFASYPYGNETVKQKCQIVQPDVPKDSKFKFLDFS